MLHALRLCENNFARYYLNEEFEEVEFDFQLNDDIVIGQPFKYVLVPSGFSGLFKQGLLFFFFLSSFLLLKIASCITRRRLLGMGFKDALIPWRCKLGFSDYLAVCESLQLFYRRCVCRNARSFSSY